MCEIASTCVVSSMCDVEEDYNEITFVLDDRGVGLFGSHKFY